MTDRDRHRLLLFAAILTLFVDVRSNIYHMHMSILSREKDR